MNEVFFRFLAGGRGIYEAVDIDCPRNDPRRVSKPDGSWLPKVGPKHPGAISFWTRTGLEKYIQSGLQDWHRRVVRDPVRVQISSGFTPVLYGDEYQVICDRSAARVTREVSWRELALELSDGKPVQKVVAYVARTRASGLELLVFEHEKKWSEAGLQVPAGTVDPGESLEAAVLREIAEESGLRDLNVVQKVDDYVFYRATHSQYQQRHVYLISSSSEPPERWEHRVSGKGIDEGMTFTYYWLPIRSAFEKLAGGLGDSIPLLERTAQRAGFKHQ